MDVTPVADATAFATIFNFRDVGGVTGLDGRLVRRRRLYRSDSLHRIDGPDREAFAALGIRTVIDLRRPYEVARDGRVPAYDGLVYQHIHPEHEEWLGTPYREEVGSARYLADRYRDMTETGAAGLASAIEVIADAEAAPVVVHCVAGKDRTGVVCALTLALLGVADEDIAADYARSSEGSARFRAWFEATVGAAQLPAPLFESPAEAMLLFLRELRERHGSVADYLIRAGLPAERISALRAHLLE